MLSATARPNRTSTRAPSRVAIAGQRRRDVASALTAPCLAAGCVPPTQLTLCPDRSGNVTARMIVTATAVIWSAGAGYQTCPVPGARSRRYRTGAAGSLPRGSRHHRQERAERGAVPGCLVQPARHGLDQLVVVGLCGAGPVGDNRPRGGMADLQPGFRFGKREPGVAGPPCCPLPVVIMRDGHGDVVAVGGELGGHVERLPAARVVAGGGVHDAVRSRAEPAAVVSAGRTPAGEHLGRRQGGIIGDAERVHRVQVRAAAPGEAGEKRRDRPRPTDPTQTRDMRQMSVGWRASPWPMQIEVIPGYTKVMKTAISLPDDTYEQATRQAQALGISRSEFFARAARSYLDQLASRSLTQQIDEALRTTDDDSNAAAAAAGRSYLAGQDDW